MSLRSVFRAFTKLFNPVVAFLLPKVASIVVSIASLACGGFAPLCAAVGQAEIAYYHGASLDKALEAGARAGVSAYAFQLAGDFGASGSGSTFSYHAAHAAAGCVSAAVSGGACGSGAASGVFGHFATGLTGGIGGDGLDRTIARGVVTVVAGGIGSVIAGGKFANGAETAAYGYLFNELQHCMGNQNCMKSAGYEPTYYTNDGILCNGSGDPLCRFPGALAPNSAAQLSATAGATAMWGFIGTSKETGHGMNSTGQFCRVSSTCSLYGLGAGAAGDLNVQLSGGTLGNGWQAALFGAGALPLGGGELGLGFGSDGGYFSFSRSRGLLGGVGIKICVQTVSGCKPGS